MTPRRLRGASPKPPTSVRPSPGTCTTSGPCSTARVTPTRSTLAGCAGAIAQAYYLLNSRGEVDAAQQMLARAVDALGRVPAGGNSTRPPRSAPRRA